MEPIAAHWLDIAKTPDERTPGLGIRLEGVNDRRSNSMPSVCRNCGGPRLLFATYENSGFIHLANFALITLDVCPKCSLETDGSPGGNGFFPLLRQKADALSEPALPAAIYFCATPTGEPPSEREFRKWRPHMRAKLGGRQLSIQPALEADCQRCSAPLLFVSSIDEQWAPGLLNFAGGFGYLFVCKAECSPDSALFYWDCD